MADNDEITTEVKIEIMEQCTIEMEQTKEEVLNDGQHDGEENAEEVLNSSKESEPENLEAIKKFIQDQEREICRQQVGDNSYDTTTNENNTKQSNIEETNALEINSDEKNEQENNTDEKNALEVNTEENNALVINTEESNAQEINIEEKNIVGENSMEEINIEDKDTDEEKNTNVKEETPEEEEEVKNEVKESNKPSEVQEDTMAVATSVMDMILSQSEAKICQKKNENPIPKECLTSVDKGNSSMALSVGSKVEAKDFAELWHQAQIMEVDYDEMEVLVHYEDGIKKHDEWISVSSPRLRPLGSSTLPTTPVPKTMVPPKIEPVAAPELETKVQVKEEQKHEEKPKITFAIGERCLARWRDNRRFIATINQDLGEGKYEIIFDDGVRWTCATIRLSKLKEPSKKDFLSVDTNLPSASSTPSPVDGPGPGTNQPSDIVANSPAFHTHLFDPTRDYLGSKSERREMKRKLNIKEIFNIGQKKKKTEYTPRSSSSRNRDRAPKASTSKEKKSQKAAKKKVCAEPIKTEVPDAVASIIGTVTKEEPIEQPEVKLENIEEVEIKTEHFSDPKMDLDATLESTNSETLSAPETLDLKMEEDVVIEEEKLEKFEQSDNGKQAEQVIDRIKEVINKLEDGLKAAESPKLDIKDEPPNIKEQLSDSNKNIQEIPKKNLSKVKKGKKLRLLQEKKVKKQVEKVKSELEEMKRQVEEMRKEMLQKTEALAKTKSTEMPESFLLPGEWCCKWVNGQPVGTVSEIEQEEKADPNKPALPRRSVQVEDKRLPPGWTKHMVRRSFGHSAGKWDVVLVNPDNRRFHSKTDMRNYLENCHDPSLEAYEHALMDFGVHLKLSRRMGWFTVTPDGEQEAAMILHSGSLFNTNSTSPIVKKKKLSLKQFVKIKDKKKKKKKLTLRLKVRKDAVYEQSVLDDSTESITDVTVVDPTTPMDLSSESVPPLEDGYVYVGSLKVQIIENLLRCPAEGCLKNFRNNTLLKMHIKHYHRELRKMLGATPKVLDLAYARQRPTAMEITKMKHDAVHKTIRVKLPRLPRRYTEAKLQRLHKDAASNLKKETPTTPRSDVPKVPRLIPRSQDSPKLRQSLNKPVKRPKVLLPVRRPAEPEQTVPEIKQENDDEKPIVPKVEVPLIEPLDFETAISTHTVTKAFSDVKRKGEKKRKTFASIAKKPASEDEEYYGMNNSDIETRSSYPRSGTPDSKTMEQKLISSESNEDQKEPNAYLFTETGERIKIVHMKREEIINCHCGFREEDGLMVQCELCLCWQHALCHNIQKETDVPEKYTCSICLNPRRGRRSQRFLHDQDRLYEGLLPGAKPCESLRRSHELSGNLIRIDDALHALRVKYYVATKKDHPKLYLWAKDWETGELTMTQEKLNSDYSDLNIMISDIGKENLPMKEDVPLEIKTPPSEEQDERFSQKDNQLGSQALLSGLLSSPGGASLDLPISTLELERLAKTVQAEQEAVRIVAPQPEAAIENSACRERLLRHIQRCQALIDARLDSIEAQVAELESQDPSFEDDETADYFPRTKQTIQMLTRDLDTMEELGNIT